MNLHKKSVNSVLLTLLITGCASTPPEQTTVYVPPEETVIEESSISSEENFLLTAESKATYQGRRILETGRQMTWIDEEIIPGGCWDYANEVYNRAGYPNRSGKRQTVFKGSRDNGPYADISLIQHGDFLYYINHSYGGIEHSAIFVDWLDYGDKIGLMLSYGGESRQAPARYLPYDLSNVYRIVRGSN